MEMTVEKGLRSCSPVHVHVEDDTPLHVHVKGKHKRSKTQENGRRSTMRQHTISSRSRSRSPTLLARTGPWVPPPAKTTKGKKSLTWDGGSHRLEVNPPTQILVRQGELDTEDEERGHSQVRRYEKKIDNLMGEVGALKNQVDVHRALREIDRKEDELETSRLIIAEQENEIRHTKHDLVATSVENRSLRKSVEKLATDADIARSLLDEEKDELMRKLIEVELDGQDASKQLAKVRDTLRKMQSRRVTAAENAALSRQKEELFCTLADFETANRALRRLIRDRHRAEGSQVRLGEQREVLMRKLTEGEDEKQRLRAEVLDKSRTISDLRRQLVHQREESVAVASQHDNLENTRAHLQKHLRQREADCNRLAVQVRTLESALAQDKIEVEHVTGLLSAAKEKGDRDREALKRATRIQKQRAARSEDAVENLNSQLLEREGQLTEALTQVDTLKVRAQTSGKEKHQLQTESATIKARLAEVEHELGRIGETSRMQVETLQAKLQAKTGEAGALKLDNERLQSAVTSIEDKLCQGEKEISHLRANVKEYEHLLEEYRTQTTRSRHEADELQFHLDEQHHETTRVQQDGDREIERLRNLFQQKLEEFEPLPDMLKTAELDLHDAREKSEMTCKKNGENVRLIDDLTGKIERQSGQLHSLTERGRLYDEENRALHSKLDAMERKLTMLEEQNRELVTGIRQKDETAKQHNVLLEEKARENASLARQLEAALTDARRQVEASRDHTTSRERTSQQRLADLETQLSRLKAETSQAKREKEEAERRFNSRLYDLRDRLEQSHSTNRSMQNYVQFLKNSYSNVFGDAATMPGPASPGLPPPGLGGGTARY